MGPGPTAAEQVTALESQYRQLEEAYKDLEAQLVTAKERIGEADGCLAESMRWNVEAWDQLDILRKRIGDLMAKADATQQQAEQWKQEARTANATIAECYRVVTGGTGEPGNWHGAEPVRESFAALRAEVEELRRFNTLAIKTDEVKTTEIVRLRAEVERNTTPPDDKRMTPEEWGEAWRDRALELQRCGVCYHWDRVTCPEWREKRPRFHTCPSWKFGG